MQDLNMQDLFFILPELFIVLAALVLLIYGLYCKEAHIKVQRLTLIVLLITIFLLYFVADIQGLAFSDSFIQDNLSLMMKTVLLLFGFFVLLLGYVFYGQDFQPGYEFSVIALFSIVGMMMMISANSFILVYLGLELQSLSLYILVTYRRDHARSAEAGLKYFVLGALSSGLLLYGMSLIYGFSGSVIFGEIADKLVLVEAEDQLIVTFGIVFIMAGIAFKISAVPFHMWAPDVYEGTTTPVTAFLAILPKFAAMIMLIRIVHDVFGSSASIWLQLIGALCLASMVLGGIAAIGQANIKRLMAYSSIGHIGYMLVGLAASATYPHIGVEAVLFYLIIYMVMSLGSFAVILSLRTQDGASEKIADLAGYSQLNGKMAACFAVMLFSLAGVPPLAGFFGKYFVFVAAIRAELYFIAIIGVLSSVIAVYYYLRIIKIMYFDPVKHVYEAPAKENVAISVIAAVLVMSFVFYPSLLSKFVEISLDGFFSQ